ncbi:MAG: hypothetical protein QF552_11795 [Litorilituus sp.]|jgi:uncharacterized membrane protein|nr:hypothetical protein [Litorilituus sp.]
MTDVDLFFLARSVHVLAVVIWIGGVAFITTVLLPALKKLASSEQRIKLFEQLEHTFSWQAKLTTLATGISGYYMLDFFNAWHRYLDINFWWLHLMTLVWFIFTLVLFVLEPLFLHRWFLQQAKIDSDKTFATIQRMHNVLLTLSLIAVFCAVAGAHGYF